MNSIIRISEAPYQVEFSLDLSVFPLSICLKSVYTFLDRAYFFFERDHEKNHLIVKAISRNEKKWASDKLLLDLSDELIATTLREALEKENKTIRDAIVMKALWSIEDHANISPHEQENKEEDLIDFTKDVDALLKEIETIEVPESTKKKPLNVNDYFHAKKALKNR